MVSRLATVAEAPSPPTGFLSYFFITQKAQWRGERLRWR
jgi:hypothetical protein